jgi:hypothetical protein
MVLRPYSKVVHCLGRRRPARPGGMHRHLRGWRRRTQYAADRVTHFRRSRTTGTLHRPSLPPWVNQRSPCNRAEPARRQKTACSAQARKLECRCDPASCHSPEKKLPNHCQMDRIVSTAVGVAGGWTPDQSLDGQSPRAFSLVCGSLPGRGDEQISSLQFFHRRQ